MLGSKYVQLLDISYNYSYKYNYKLYNQSYIIITQLFCQIIFFQTLHSLVLVQGLWFVNTLNYVIWWKN